MRKSNDKLQNPPYPSPWQRIDNIIGHYRISSISAFARQLGLKRAENLYQIKRGNNGISKELAERISEKFPAISKAWVLTGEGPMLLSENTVDASSEPEARSADKIIEYRIRLVVSFDSEPCSGE